MGGGNNQLGDTIGGPVESEEERKAKANLKGSVGGVQGILQIQAAVAAGTAQYDSAIATLIEIYGFNEESAKRILGTPKLSVQ